MHQTVRYISLYSISPWENTCSSQGRNQSLQVKRQDTQYSRRSWEVFAIYAIKFDPQRSAEGKPPCHGPFRSAWLHSRQGTLALLDSRTKRFGCTAHRSDNREFKLNNPYENSNWTIRIWWKKLLAYLVTWFTLDNLQRWFQLFQAITTSKMTKHTISSP